MEKPVNNFFYNRLNICCKIGLSAKTFHIIFAFTSEQTSTLYHIFSITSREHVSLVPAWVLTCQLVFFHIVNDLPLFSTCWNYNLKPTEFGECGEQSWYNNVDYFTEEHNWNRLRQQNYRRAFRLHVIFSDWVIVWKDVIWLNIGWSTGARPQHSQWKMWNVSKENLCCGQDLDLAVFFMWNPNHRCN